MNKILTRASHRLARLNKTLVATGVAVIGAVESQAAVTYDSVTGFAGTIDMTAFDTAVPIVVTVIGIVIAVTLGVKMLTKSKSA